MAPSCGTCASPRGRSVLGTTLSQAARITPRQTQVSCGTLSVVEPEDPEPEERDLTIPILAAGGIGAAILLARNKD